MAPQDAKNGDRATEEEIRKHGYEVKPEEWERYGNQLYAKRFPVNLKLQFLVYPLRDR